MRFPLEVLQRYRLFAYVLAIQVAEWIQQQSSSWTEEAFPVESSGVDCRDDWSRVEPEGVRRVERPVLSLEGRRERDNERRREREKK